MSFAARFAVPTREELAALARKYDALADLRERRERGDGVAPRAELMALAREFPGALRELDTLPRAEIELRRTSLRAALAGGTREPWMAWLIAYHATMRAALFVKARLARRADAPHDAHANDVEQRAARRAGALSDDAVRAIALDAAGRFALPIDDAFVRAVARPRARRINAAVFDRLGRELGVPPDVMWEALFPARRASRLTT